MDELVRRRGRLKGKLTRIRSFVDQSRSVPFTIADVKIRLDMLEEIWSDFDVTQTKIECTCEEGELDVQQNEQEDFENRFCAVKAILIEAYDQLSQQVPLLVKEPDGVISNHSPHIRLPNIELPTFSGDYKKWTAFSDLFTSVIHNNATLTPVQKLHYLKSSLRDDAGQLLNSIAVTEANYDEAWKILVSRYSNKRQIVQSHLKSLYKQTKLVNESPIELRRLLDVTVENVRALHALGLPTDQWDCLLLFLVTERLDNTTRRQWELSIAEHEDPKFDQLSGFLEKRCRALEVTSADQKKLFVPVKGGDRVTKRTGTTATYHAVATVCSGCRGHHHLFKCDKFKGMTVDQHIDLVRAASLCFNCLGSGHRSNECKSGGCKECQRRHNTLLHRKRTQEATGNEPPVVSHHSIGRGVTQVLLATAVVNLRDQYGNTHPIRALLDSGSQATFIRMACVQRLGLKQQKVDIKINGLGSSNLTGCKGMVQIHLSSAHSSYAVDLQALVMHAVTGHLPRHPLDPAKLADTIRAHNFQLADPGYHLPGTVDLLLGADVYFDLLLSGKFKDRESPIIFQNTSLGWIISGPVTSDDKHHHVTTHLGIAELSEQLRCFWELEEVRESKMYTAEEQECEAHFKASYTRTDEGRFVVRLPFRNTVTSLGKSRVMACQRLMTMERRLKMHPSYNQDYCSFMKEYLALGHMEKVTNIHTSVAYYLPHHYVIKESSTTTKLRVVFDGTARPSGGLSLNEVLKVGPTIQSELLDIIMRFRTHNTVFIADITKMYRQVLLHEDDCDYQRILWRESSAQSISEYRLKTLTYGTATAPFLAVRCLVELATQYEATYPLATNIIRRDFYVDDLISGARSVNEALEIQTQLITILAAAGFEIRKWASNSTELIEQLPEQLCNGAGSLDLSYDHMIKTLGIHWQPTPDHFTFKVAISVPVQITKRSILSNICKLFDPLGWLAPVVLQAKVVIQQLWLLGVGWDSELPNNIVSYWRQYMSEMCLIENIKIDRHMVADSINKNWQLHGFSDASELAYGAVIFIRSITDRGPMVKLVCSKSRVAPLKKISIPRLELCGALLLARLLTRVTATLVVAASNVYAWTDSTVVLCWIGRHPHSWKTFVANRVTEIQELFPPEHWKHVTSSNNPADCLSRGLSPGQIVDHDLWWNGPAWLKLDEAQWPVGHQPLNSDLAELEVKRQKVLVCTSLNITSEILTKYSTLTRLVRITAYCLRFSSNCRKAQCDRSVGCLSTSELHHGLSNWIKYVQRSHFKQELHDCISGDVLSSKSSLVSLNPFLDSEGILRVGGRLQESNLSYNSKHPIILPHSNPLTELLIRHEHINNLHAGPQLLAATLQRNYWIIRARQTIRRVIHRCVQCFRHRVRTSQQLMGNLPKGRVESVRAFTRCGVDYAGPFMIRPRGRGNLMKTKAYVCIFICFATRAIHIELASDLSTESFLAALRRFIARRGKPSDIFSDCGTNFIGADGEIKKLYKLMSSARHNDQFSSVLGVDGTNWHFNPPVSPHFGGLWEAGVKSIKYHLRRSVGKTVMTFEETYTILVQIEACLNSRPLCPLSSDPDDLDALTPGHFLIGQALNALPERDVLLSSPNRLTRWHLVQQTYQHFWKRWSIEYLARLQQRPKWTTRVPNIAVGDLLLLCENNLAPLHWPLARVVAVHPGKDDLVRTVTVKCKNGLYKRPITKCCILPFQRDSD